MPFNALKIKAMDASIFEEHSTNIVENKEVVVDNVVYKITVSEIQGLKNLTISSSNSNLECSIIGNKENEILGEIIYDTKSNEIVENVDVEDFEDVVVSEAYNKKVKVAYGGDYWYQKENNLKHIKIGCNKTYTVPYAGNIKRVNALNSYMNAINTVNKHQKNCLAACATAGVSYAVVCVMTAVNIVFPETVIVDAIIAYVGCGDAVATVVAMGTAVHECVLMIHSSGKVHDKYEAAKKYA